MTLSTMALSKMTPSKLTLSKMTLSVIIQKCDSIMIFSRTIVMTFRIMTLNIALKLTHSAYTTLCSDCYGAGTKFTTIHFFVTYEWVQ